MAFLTDLATNATAHNMTIIIFSANDDALIPHLGSQGRSPIVFIVTRLMRSYSNHPGEILINNPEQSWRSFIPFHRIRHLVVSRASLASRRRHGTMTLAISRASYIKNVAGSTSLLYTQDIFSVIPTPSLSAKINSIVLHESNALVAGLHARSGVYLWQQPNGTRHQHQLWIDLCYRRRGGLPW